MSKLKDGTILNYDEYKDQHGSVVPPIYQNSLFTFDSWDDIDRAFDHKNSAHIYTPVSYTHLTLPTKRIV